MNTTKKIPVRVVIGILSVTFLVGFIEACNRVPTAKKTTASTGEPQSIAPGEQSAEVDGTSGATSLTYSLTISGQVRHPMTLSPSDLNQYQSIPARLNDVHGDGSFHGVHEYRGIPLKSLLDQAHIEKGESIFGRPIDLAVVVRNQKGDEVVLSWGEIFYRNPADVLVAYSASPIWPHKSCSNCHDKGTYQKWIDQLKRDIRFPKLLLSGDQWSDRAIENITSIEVRDLGKDVGVFLKKEDRPKKLFAPGIVVSGPDFEPVTVKDLSKFQRSSAKVAQAGDGTGYHGIKQFDGVLLADVLRDAGIKPDPKTSFVCSAPDGYRILLSSGEIFNRPVGTGVLLADRMDGKEMVDGGSFRLIPMWDLSADRWLKSVSRIDIVTTDHK